MEEMTKQSQEYDPFMIKNILMSTATDLQNDPFTQGSGLTNIETALKYVHGDDGVFIVYNDASYLNIKKILDPSIENINSTIGFEEFQLPMNSFPMTSWFAGQLLPGDRTTTTFTIKNPTNETLSVNVKPETLSLMTKTQLNGKTITHQQNSLLNETGTYTLLTHSTLFGGESTTEPLTLAAKFTNISSEIILQNKQIDIESTPMPSLILKKTLSLLLKQNLLKTLL